VKLSSAVSGDGAKSVRQFVGTIGILRPRHSVRFANAMATLRMTKLLEGFDQVSSFSKMLQDFLTKGRQSQLHG